MDSGGKLTPCLALHVKGLGTDVVMHPWDLSASASLSSLAIVEKIHGTGGGPLYLVQTPVGAELLSVKFVMVKYLILWGLLHVFKTQFWPVCITCGVGHRWPLTRCWLCHKLRKKQSRLHSRENHHEKTEVRSAYWVCNDVGLWQALVSREFMAIYRFIWGRRRSTANLGINEMTNLYTWEILFCMLKNKVKNKTLSWVRGSQCFGNLRMFLFSNLYKWYSLFSSSVCRW